MSHVVFDHVDKYLVFGREYDCSDVHLATNFPPAWRRHGDLTPIWDDHEPLTPQQTEKLARSFLDDFHWDLLQQRGDADFAYSDASDGRYRASVVKQRTGYNMVFRVIGHNARTLESLGLPIEHIIPLLSYQNGIILLTGSVGTGKSSTLAAMINYINEHRNEHILSIESPVEFVIKSRNCHVNQREIVTHTISYAKALRAALREDPDVIMIGEMRDLETIQLGMTAAETGHLVLSTLHTGSASRTVDRILDVFPIEQRDQIRVMLSESLRGIISQQLVPRADGNGRVLAYEMLVNTPAIANCIREGKTYMIPGIMQTGKSVGMMLMDDCLKQHYVKGMISAEDALYRCEDKKLMREFLRS